MITDWVDPFIATLGDHGQLYPGATTPFGLVKLSPETTGKGHSGYQYEEKYIYPAFPKRLTSLAWKESRKMLFSGKIVLNFFGYMIVMCYICTRNDTNHGHSKTVGQAVRHNICL